MTLCTSLLPCEVLEEGREMIDINAKRRGYWMNATQPCLRSDFVLTPLQEKSPPNFHFLHPSPGTSHKMAASLWTCGKCLRGLKIWPNQIRLIHDSTLQKRIVAEWDWTDHAAEIRKGTRKSMLAILEERGFIHQIAG
jgi:hypothetical protein